MSNKMEEHPIIFSTEMVRAILEGKKTQTRRVIKPQPLGSGEMQLSNDRLWRLGIGGRYNLPRIDFSQKPWCCSYGQVGDRLWVRETFWVTGSPDSAIVVYKATYSHPKNISKWRSPIFMSRWASRILLEIADIRIEKLQDISYESTKAEGCVSISDYAILWNSINAKRGYDWLSNPWVWVIEFKLLKGG